MPGMLTKILDVGTSVAAFGNAARSAVPVPNIIGDACGTRDLAPSPRESAPFEWFAGLAVNDDRADAATMSGYSFRSIMTSAVVFPILLVRMRS